MPLRCKVFARLNDCANCDEVDVSFKHKKRKVSIVIKYPIGKSIFAKFELFPVAVANAATLEV